MYEQIVMYVTAIAPSLATVVTAIAMFIKIVSRTKKMAASLKDDTQKKLQEAMDDAQYALMETLKKEVKRVTDSNELCQCKEQYKQVQKDLQELTRQNAELLAKLNARGYYWTGEFYGAAIQLQNKYKNQEDLTNEHSTEH